MQGRRDGGWTRRALIGAVLSVAAAPRVARAVLRADDSLVRTCQVAPGRALALATTSGSVRVTTSARRDVLVTVHRRAVDAATLAAAPIVVDTNDGGVRVDATPGLGPGLRGLVADITIDAPAGLRLDPVTIDDGRLDIDGLSGEVRATVTRGAIRATNVSGVLRLGTSIGDVTVTRAGLTPGGLIRLRAFNGDVRLAFASPPEDARIMALALNGTITSDVPLTMKDGWGPRWGETSLGHADRVVSIDVITGTIRLEAPTAR